MNQPKSSARKAGEIISGLVFIGIGVWYYFGGGYETEVSANMQKATQDAAADAVAQYQIAARGPDKMQTCVQAGFVAAAYLQAKDEAAYNQWKATEKRDCDRASSQD